MFPLHLNRRGNPPSTRALNKVLQKNNQKKNKYIDIIITFFYEITGVDRAYQLVWMITLSANNVWTINWYKKASFISNI